MKQGEGFLLTMKEKHRVEAIQAFEGGRLTEQEAARVLGRSVRTVYRLQARLRHKGIEGLVHGNKGRVSPRRHSVVLQRRILRLVRARYFDVYGGPQKLDRWVRQDFALQRIGGQRDDTKEA